MTSVALTALLDCYKVQHTLNLPSTIVVAAAAATVALLMPQCLQVRYMV